MLTSAAPFSPRIVNVIPALMVPPALVLDAAWRGVAALGRRAGLLIALAALGFLTLAGAANYRGYFYHFVRRERPADFNTELSHYLLRQGDDYRYFLIGVDGPSLRYETQRFLVPGVDGTDVGAGAIQLPVGRVLPRKGLVFIVEAAATNASARLAAIRRAYPRGYERAHADRLHHPLFTSYVVSAHQARRPVR